MTRTLYGLPGMGVAARAVYPNSKCSGCLHFDRDLNLSGLCLVGLLPDVCGDGRMPAVSYSPLLARATNLPLDLVESARPSASGAENEGAPKMEVVDFEKIGVNFDQIAKSVFTELQEQAAYACPSHQGRQGIGGTVTMDQAYSRCRCTSISRREIAKSIFDRLPNRAKDVAARGGFEDFVAKSEERVYQGRVYPTPGAEKKPPTYLPGVHSSDSPVRPARGDAGKLFGVPKKPAAAVPKKPAMAKDMGDDEEEVEKGLKELEVLLEKADQYHRDPSPKNPVWRFGGEKPSKASRSYASEKHQRMGAFADAHGARHYVNDKGHFHVANDPSRAAKRGSGKPLGGIGEGFTHVKNMEHLRGHLGY